MKGRTIDIVVVGSAFLFCVMFLILGLVRNRYEIGIVCQRSGSFPVRQFNMPRSSDRQGIEFLHETTNVAR